MKHLTFITLSVLLFLSSCIGDDIIFDTVEEEVRLIQFVDTLGVGATYQFEAVFLNNLGEEANQAVTWQSSDSMVISIDDSGLAVGLSKGVATITASVTVDTKTIESAIEVIVAEETVAGSSIRSGTIQTTSSYVLTGKFTLEQDGANLLLSIGEDYEASEALPGLYVYLTNNPNTINNAFEIGAVEVFKGAHSYKIENTALNEFNYVLYYCKPFVVKVGDGEIE